MFSKIIIHRVGNKVNQEADFSLTKRIGTGRRNKEELENFS